MAVVTPGQYQIAKHIKALFPDATADKVAIRREDRQWIIKIDLPDRLIEIEADTLPEAITALDASAKIADSFKKE